MTYRLTSQVILNIASLRWANQVFEPTWNFNLPLPLNLTLVTLTLTLTSRSSSPPGTLTLTLALTLVLTLALTSLDVLSPNPSPNSTQVFEPTWNAKHIESVQLTFKEDLGTDKLP